MFNTYRSLAILGSTIPELLNFLCFVRANFFALCLNASLSTSTTVFSLCSKPLFVSWFYGRLGNTEFWVADSTDHMIHFNGDKFLGPYKP